MLLEIIGKGLLDIQDAVEDRRLLRLETVEHIAYIRRFFHSAVEIRGQVFDILFQCDTTNADNPLVIPGCVVSGQLDLEVFQPIAIDPVLQKDGVRIPRFLAGQVVHGQRILAADEMARGDRGRRLAARHEILLRIPALKLGAVFLRIIGRQIPIHVLGVEAVEHGNLVELSIRVIERQIERRAAHQRRQIRHLLRLGTICVLFGQAFAKPRLEKMRADLHRMADGGFLPPCRAQRRAKGAHPLHARFLGQLARPAPCGGQRRFAVSAGGAPILALQGHAHKHGFPAG